MQHRLSILVIAEEESALRPILSSQLYDAGYQVFIASESITARTIAQQQQIVLMLLDLTGPHLDGLETCRRLRASQETALVPLIMLANQADEMDVIVGLEVGADDYVVDVLRWRELLARIRAVLRRSFSRQCPICAQRQAQQKKQIISVGDFVIDLAGRTVLWQHQSCALTPREFDVFLCLLRHQGMTLTRKQLLEQVWGIRMGSGRRVDAVVYGLREKIEKDPSHPQWIHTIRGTGYRFTNEGVEAGEIQV